MVVLERMLRLVGLGVALRLALGYFEDAAKGIAG